MRIRLGIRVGSGVRPLGATGTRGLGHLGTGVRMAGMEDMSADVRTDVLEEARIRHRWRSEKRSKRRHRAHDDGDIALDDTIKGH